MSAAGCRISSHVGTNNELGIVALEALQEGAEMVACPSNALLSDVRGQWTALRAQCHRIQRCCVPLQVLDALSSDVLDEVYDSFVLWHLRVLPEGGEQLHSALAPQVQCVPSHDARFWTNMSKVGLDISCKDHPDHGYLARATLVEWLKFQALAVRSFESPLHGRVMFPLMDSMALSELGDVFTPELEERSSWWILRAPRAYGKGEPLLRRPPTAHMDSWLFYLTFGRISLETVWDRVVVARATVCPTSSDDEEDSDSRDLFFDSQGIASPSLLQACRGCGCSLSLLRETIFERSVQCAQRTGVDFETPLGKLIARQQDLLRRPE